MVRKRGLWSKRYVRGFGKKSNYSCLILWKCFKMSTFESYVLDSSLPCQLGEIYGISENECYPGDAGKPPKAAPKLMSPWHVFLGHVLGKHHICQNMSNSLFY